MAVNAEPGVNARKTTPEILGEFMREVALLVLVFVPLEFFLQIHERYRWRVMIGAVVVCGVLLTAGIMMERKRPS